MYFHWSSYFGYILNNQMYLFLNECVHLSLKLRLSSSLYSGSFDSFLWFIPIFLFFINFNIYLHYNLLQCLNLFKQLNFVYSTNSYLTFYWRNYILLILYHLFNIYFSFLLSQYSIFHSCCSFYYPPLIFFYLLSLRLFFHFNLMIFIKSIFKIDFR